MDIIGRYILIGGLFAAIDAVWIGVVANKFYKSQLGDLLMEKPNFVPAVLFYLISIAAMQALVVTPALNHHYSIEAVMVYGALLGLSSYATYDLTNASTLKNWPKAMTLVDMAWGTVLTSAVTTTAFAILR